MHNSVTYLNRILIFEWFVVRCGFKNRHVFKRSWTLCLKYNNHLDSIVNIIAGSIRLFNKHDNIHFDNE